MSAALCSSDAPSDSTSVQAYIEQIDQALPQTQCTQCGFAGCMPYARAIALEGAAINRCPPGGQAGVARLAALTGQAEQPLDPACGIERPRQVARIVPDLCIGCTLCIQACPVDAIAGAPQSLHAVLTDACTGCRLCVAPCPVDCIEMVAPPPDALAWSDHDAEKARARHRRQQQRCAKPVDAPPSLEQTTGTLQSNESRKKAILAAAMQRAQNRLARAPDAS
jgi:electron transport complex protein RnfB